MTHSIGGPSSPCTKKKSVSAALQRSAPAHGGVKADGLIG